MLRPSAARHAIVASLLLLGLVLLPTGSAQAISYRTFITANGAAAGDFLGISVAPAGDFNGDGYADIIVGAFASDAGVSDGGAAFIYFGGPDADDVADLTLTGAVTGDSFGIAVAAAGDVNGDGWDDVIVGAPNNGTGGTDAGRAYVYYGGPDADDTADLTLTGEAASDYLGSSVAGAGDVNGDGCADVIVGAPQNDSGGSDAGRAYVYYGGASPDAVADLTLTGAAATNYFGRTVAGAGDVNGDGRADVIVGAYANDISGADAGRVYVYYGGPGADTVADLTIAGAAAGDRFGWSVAGAGDVNGDRYADVIIGATWNDGGGTNAGRAYVYLGGAAPDTVADLTLTGAAAGDWFGWSVGSAGDVNGDGSADLIVGAYANDVGGSEAGRAYIYLGGSGTDNVADITLTGEAVGDRLGYSVAPAGDVDGDGWADVIVGAMYNDAGGTNAGRACVYAVYPYQVLSPNGGEQWVAGRPATVRWLGHDVADLALSTNSGLSWSTIAVGVGGLEENEYTLTAPSIATDYAKVRLTYTAQTSKRSTSDASDGVFRVVLPAEPPAAAQRLLGDMPGLGAGDYFGWAVAGAGDVNGDGYADIIAGAANGGGGGPEPNYALVFYGGPGADGKADLILRGESGDDSYGSRVSTAGDMNGDGYADVIVGAPSNDSGGSSAGRAYVYCGGAAPDTVADLTLTGAAASNLGISVSCAGDVNGDGFSDIIVGALGSDVGGSGHGAAFVYHGGSTLDTAPNITLPGPLAGEGFSYAVASAGDIDGDGFSDVMVGATYGDLGGANAGMVYIYYCGPGGDDAPDLTLVGGAAGDRLGYSLASAGDVDGDGHDDVIAGAPYSDAGGSQSGRAHVYYGGPDADAVPDLILTGAAAEDEFGTTVAGAGDVNGDGFADVIVGAPYNDAGGYISGRAYVYFGGPGGDNLPDFVLTGTAASDIFGFSVSGAGDVNGDGFPDIVVGAPYDDAAGTASGCAYAYECNRYFVTAPNGGETWNVGGKQTLSWLGAEPADLWLSTDGGGSYEMLEHAVGGSESNALALRVPHAPTRFARVKVTPADASLTGSDQSDSLFTIQTSVSLLSLKAEPGPGGTVVTWSTDPGVGPEGLAGYRLYRVPSGSEGNGVRIGPELMVETSYIDANAATGSAYRLCAVNGLQEELELGRIAPAAAFTGMRVWPSPARAGSAVRITISAPALAPGVLVQGLEVVIYDLQGRRVAELRPEAAGESAGQLTLTWDGRGAAGGPAASGIYFVVARSTAPGVQFEAWQRLVMVK